MAESKHFSKIIILGIISALILGFLAVYILFWRVGEDGQVRPLSEFLPFGKAPEDTIIPDRSNILEIIPGSAASSTEGAIGDGNVRARPVLEQITQRYAAGAVILEPTKNFGEGDLFDRVRYMERATGNTYEYEVGSGREPIRLTNTTIPRVYEALWVEGGDGVIARLLADDYTTIRSFYGNIEIAQDATSSPGALEGVFLPQNITTIAASPDGSSIFYVKEEGFEAVMVRAKPDGSSSQILQTIPIKQWQVFWPRASEIIVSTKPSAQVLGHSFSLSTDGTMRGLQSSVHGLTVLGDQISRFYLYGGQYDRGYTLVVHDRRTVDTGSLKLTTIPEKCVWSELENAVFCAVPLLGIGGEEPDNW
jgi:hypothetical protein